MENIEENMDLGTFAGRFRYIRKYIFGYNTISSFAKYLKSVTHQQISNYENGKSTPNFAVLTRVYEKKPNINPSWVLLGNGDVFLPNFQELDNRLNELEKDKKNMQITIEYLQQKLAS